MENGHEEKMTHKMSGLALNEQSFRSNSGSSNNNNNNNNDSLFQVMKAVEAAEATIKQQVEENIRLRSELQKKIQELEKIKLDKAVAKNHHSDETWHEQSNRTYEVYHPDPSVGSHVDRTKGTENTHPPDALILQMDQHLGSEVASLHTHVERQTEGSKINGVLNGFPRGQAILNSSAMSQISSPSTISMSPKRSQVENHDPQFNISSNGLMQMAEPNNSGNLQKQDLALKIREHEEEIMRLRKHLAEYSIKDTQIRNEKYVLEKRIAYMRLAFDQQQQDLVDAASKALSYRQDIIEENIRLAYALQAAQQERTTFVSSLLPLLAEYSLQPPVSDAQSIVSNVKVLFRHFQEKLILTESKLKEFQYQLTPWNADVNHLNVAPESPSHSIGATLTTSNKNGFELVPQSAFSHGRMPVSSEVASGWDIASHHQGGLSAGVARKMEADDIGRYSPFASRSSAAHDTSVQLAVSHTEGYDTRHNEESTNKQVTFRDPVSSSELGDSEADGQRIEREPPPNWGPGSSPYGTTLDEQGTYSPYLPPVPEDPSSSYSEAADDDPLPAIEGLQISGEAFPGWELQACGYSINGTTSCNFEWVRHLEDGSVNYIDGAKQPNYLVTADDVDAYLAIEVQPLDNRKRKGELVKVFANEHRKITCDPEMLSQIEKNLSNGNISYKVSLSTRYLSIWEPAVLAIKREGYSIKWSGSNGVAVTEKFTQATSVTIPYGHPTLFSIIGSDGREHLLRADNISEISCSRDTIVLTLRFFIMRAAEKRKLRRKGLFFK